MNIAKNILEKKAEGSWTDTTKDLRKAIGLGGKRPGFLGTTWEGVKKLPENLMSNWQTPTALAGGTGIAGLGLHGITAKFKELARVREVEELINSRALKDTNNRLFSTLSDKLNPKTPFKKMTPDALMAKNKSILEQGSDWISGQRARGRRMSPLTKNTHPLAKKWYRDFFRNRHEMNFLKYPKLRGGARAGFLTPAVIAALTLSHYLGNKKYK